MSAITTYPLTSHLDPVSSDLAPRPLPRISIVTPSFNQGRFLEKTILSVLGQNYPNLEYIIIDGGSTDESVEIIKKYADRLTYWESEPDRGQSHAINKGFERATGEIFGWLNSDDWYHPGALNAVAEAFVANPEAGAVVGAGEMVDESGAQILYKSPVKVDLEFLCQWLNDFFWQPSTFFTNAAWQLCGPLDEDIHFAMDLDLWLKIANRFPFGVIPTMLSSSLKHACAKTAEFSVRTVMDAVAVIARHGGSKVVLADVDNYAAFLVEKEKGLMWQIDNRDAQLTWLTQQNAELNQQITGFIQQITELNQQITELNQQITELNQQRNAILNSMSWKLTGPLRALVDFIK